MSEAVQHIIKRCMEIMDKYPNIKSWEQLTHDDQETWRQLVYRGVEHQLSKYADEGEESGITIKQVSEMKGIIEWDEKLSGFGEDEECGGYTFGDELEENNWKCPHCGKPISKPE